MNKCVLDASAILALLNDESGAGMVQELLPVAVVSAVNYAEVVTRLSLLGMPENEIRQALHFLGLTIIPFDEDLAFRTGALAPVTMQSGLSLGDRACLALAHKTGYSAVTSDKGWQDLNVEVDVKVIR
jgi:PIN domain nuclease of toxin-antitoxin system